MKVLLADPAGFLDPGFGIALGRAGRQVITTSDYGRARAIVSQDRPDVVVASVDGAAGPGMLLVRELRRDNPSTLTIAVCPAESPRVAATAVHAAERVVGSGSSVDVLMAALEDAAMVRAILGDERINRLIAAGGDLSPPPLPVLEISHLSAEGDLDGVVEILEGEPVLTAQILRAANSPYFGINRQVVAARDAAVYLGVDQVAALVLGEAIVTVAASGLSVRHARMVQDRGLHAAGAVRRMSRGVKVPRWYVEAAFTAALLRDLGGLAVMRAVMAGSDVVPTDLRLETLLAERSVGDPELTISGIGAYLLSSWNVPDLVVGAVAGHEQMPSAAPGDVPGPAELVWAAAGWSDRGSSFLLDPEAAEVLSSLGLSEAVDELADIDLRIDQADVAPPSSDD